MSLIDQFSLKKTQTDLSYSQNLYFEILRNPTNSQSELVFRLALTLFSEENKHLKENRYQHFQKTLEACTDLFNMSTSSVFIRILIKKFEREPRVLKQHILNLYKIGDDVRGDSILKSLLSSDQQNRDLQHIGLAYYKKNMLNNEYVDKLIEYLEINFTDSKAWIELGNLFERNLDFEKAVKCYEEVLLLNPNDMRLFIKLGQLYFTLGTNAKLEIARKYFCYVLTNQQDNLRALYGLRNVLEFTGNSANPKTNAQNKKLKMLVEKKLKQFDTF
jgi:tetratricopeptide (TPR) repeat protein